MSNLGATLSLGLARDVIAEHFGEVAAEVASAMLEHPSWLRFTDLVKSLGIRSALPVTLDVFKAETVAVTPESIRETLLVFIQHGVVEWKAGADAPVGTCCSYRISQSAILDRLLYPLYLTHLSSESAVACMTHLFKHGQLKKGTLSLLFGEEAVDALLGLKLVKRSGMEVAGVPPGPAAKAVAGRGRAKVVQRAVESFNDVSSALFGEETVASPVSALTVLEPNFVELRFSSFKATAIEFVQHRLGPECSAVFAACLKFVRTQASDGPAGFKPLCDYFTVDDALRVSGMTSRDRVIGCLTLLSKSGDCKFVLSRAESTGLPTPAVSAPKRRKVGAAVPLAALGDAGAFLGDPQYRVDIRAVCLAIESDLVGTAVAIRCGSPEARRVYNLLNKRTAMDCGQVSEQCLVGREETQKILHLLTTEGLVQMQEGGASRAAGRSQAVSGNNNWLYVVDQPKAREAVGRLMARAAVNLRLRFRAEVQRETRLSERAQALTDQERKYLKSVSDAQDALEAQSLKVSHGFVTLRYSALLRQQ